MATLALQTSRTATGTAITFSAASSGGDRLTPGDDTFLLIKNGSAGAITVTLDATGTAFNDAAIPDTVVAVPAGADVIVPVGRNYKSASDGLAGVSYSAVASVTVAALAI